MSPKGSSKGRRKRKGGCELVELGCGLGSIQHIGVRDEEVASGVNQLNHSSLTPSYIFITCDSVCASTL